MKRIFYFCLLFFLLENEMFGEKIEIEPKEVLFIGPPPKFSETSGLAERFKCLRIIPISPNQYLALLNFVSDKINPMKKELIEKEVRDKFVAESENYEILENKYYLGLISKNGRILSLSQDLEEMNKETFIGAKAIPLIMDETENCPYGLIDISINSLFCYDFQLGFKEKYDLKLTKIENAKVIFNGKEHLIWLFAKSERDNKNKLQRIGLIFNVEKKKWLEFPFTLDTLFTEIKQKAVMAEGKKMELRIKDIKIIPFESLEASNSFKVLIEVLCGDYGSKEFVFNGIRSYFFAEINLQGISKLKQLNFWIIQNKRHNVIEDLEKNVIILPEYTIMYYLNAFTFGKDEFIIEMRPAFTFEKENGEYDEETLKALVYLFYFSNEKSTPEVLELTRYQSQNMKKFKIDDNLAVLFELENMISKYTFLSPAGCFPLKEDKPARDCLIKTEININE